MGEPPRRATDLHFSGRLLDGLPLPDGHQAHLLHFFLAGYFLEPRYFAGIGGRLFPAGIGFVVWQHRAQGVRHGRHHRWFGRGAARGSPRQGHKNHQLLPRLQRTAFGQLVPAAQLGRAHLKLLGQTAQGFAPPHLVRHAPETRGGNFFLGARPVGGRQQQLAAPRLHTLEPGGQKSQGLRQGRRGLAVFQQGRPVHIAQVRGRRRRKPDHVGPVAGRQRRTPQLGVEAREVQRILVAAGPTQAAQVEGVPAQAQRVHWLGVLVAQLVGAQAVGLGVLHAVHDGRESGHVVSRFGRHVGVQVPESLFSGAAHHALHAARAPVVGRQHQLPVVENTVEVAQVLAGGFGGFFGGHALVHPLVALQAQVAGRGPHELPEAGGPHRRLSRRNQRRFHHGQVFQIGGQVVLGQVLLEEGEVEILPLQHALQVGAVAGREERHVGHHRVIELVRHVGLDATHPVAHQVAQRGRGAQPLQPRRINGRHWHRHQRVGLQFQAHPHGVAQQRWHCGSYLAQSIGARHFLGTGPGGLHQQPRQHQGQPPGAAPKGFHLLNPLLHSTKIAQR